MPSHQEVAHAWAHKTGMQCNGKSMFYERDIIYSYGYHFPIARHIRLSNGEEAVLLTSKSYSVSTARHISYVSHACNHINTIVVSNVLANNKPEHKKNYISLKHSRMDCLKSAVKARSRQGEHLQHAEHYRNRMNEYTREFKLGYHYVHYTPDDLIEAENLMKANAERDKRETVARDKKAVEAIKAWVNGESNHCPRTTTAHVRVLTQSIPINDDDGKAIGAKNEHYQVQTSYGARVSYDKALRLFKRCKMYAQVKMTWKPPINYPGSPENKHLEDDRYIDSFRVTGIDRKGTLKVSCHTITLASMEAAAKAAGIEL